MDDNCFLDFTLNLDTVIDELKTILEKNESIIHKLLTIEHKTYANFVRPLSLLDERLSQFFTPLSHINSVKNSSKTQEIYTQALPIITTYSTRLSQNAEIYEAMKEISKEPALTDHQKRVLKLNIQNFELSGAHLDKTTKQRLEEINISMSELSNQFSQNLLEATNQYEYIIDNEDDIKGLPQSDKESISFVDKDGTVKYRLNLQMPTYIAYMTYGPNQDIRQKLYQAYTTRAPQNEEIIHDILRLRYEESQLLGFHDYADYSLASKMAPSAQKVLDFLEKLVAASTDQAKKELEELRNVSPKELTSYDIAFYSEILKQKKHNLNQEHYRPYFEQTGVLKGLFEFLRQIFGLTYKAVNLELWDDKAFAYDLYHNDKLTARLYFDLESRQNKRGGAWMHHWQTHCHDENGDTQLASAFVVCNFPASDESNPSLLRHDDVVTLFHEMGHAIHHVLSTVHESEISGVNGVEWDAVEYPSQFLENFAYEPQVLKLFAQHYQTKEVLPDSMIKQLIDAKNFQSGLSMLRQLEFSIFDLKLHMKLYKNEEVQELLDKIREQTALIKPPRYNKFQNGFSHIFAGGYAAGYYSYKWAEVLSADTFFNIIDEGIFNSETALQYFDIILKNGGSSSMYELFKKLMDREPDIDNLLRLNGIK